MAAAAPMKLRQTLIGNLLNKEAIAREMAQQLPEAFREEAYRIVLRFLIESDPIVRAQAEKV